MTPCPMKHINLNKFLPQSAELMSFKVTINFKNNALPYVTRSASSSSASIFAEIITQ